MLSATIYRCYSKLIVIIVRLMIVNKMSRIYDTISKENIMMGDTGERRQMVNRHIVISCIMIDGDVGIRKSNWNNLGI